MSQPAQVVCVDPPWPFKDKLPGGGRGAIKHYQTLSIADLCTFPLPPIANDCLLAMWRVGAMVEEAYQIGRAWGFVPTGGEIVWVKTTRMPICSVEDVAMGMGRTVRNCHETAILFRRGKPKIQDLGVRSVIFGKRGRHSAKPESFYDLMERLCAGPYVEMFARRRRAGWDCYGNELSVAEGVAMEAA